MAYQALGLGSSDNDGTGDDLRTGGDKINDNFVEIYTALGTGSALTSGISADATVVTLTAPVIATSLDMNERWRINSRCRRRYVYYSRHR